jgi:hypothetical protein
MAHPQNLALLHERLLKRGACQPKQVPIAARQNMCKRPGYDDLSLTMRTGECAA